MFHPTKPYFVVATQKHLRLYNLIHQKLLKTFTSGVKYISSVSVHPGGMVSLTQREKE
jgi:ribosome biogenesis protein ERB1